MTKPPHAVPSWPPRKPAIYSKPPPRDPVDDHFLRHVHPCKAHPRANLQVKEERVNCTEIIAKVKQILPCHALGMKSPRNEAEKERIMKRKWKPKKKITDPEAYADGIIGRLPKDCLD